MKSKQSVKPANVNATKTRKKLIIQRRNSEAQKIVDYDRAEAVTSDAVGRSEFRVDLTCGHFMVAQIFCASKTVQVKLVQGLSSAKAKQTTIMPGKEILAVFMHPKLHGWPARGIRAIKAWRSSQEIIESSIASVPVKVTPQFVVPREKGLLIVDESLPSMTMFLPYKDLDVVSLSKNTVLVTFMGNAAPVKAISIQLSGRKFANRLSNQIANHTSQILVASWIVPTIQLITFDGNMHYLGAQVQGGTTVGSSKHQS